MKSRAIALVVTLVSLPLSAATSTWTGAVSSFWSVGGNWSSGLPPAAGDDLVFPASGSNQANNDDLAPGTAFHSITVTGGSYTFAGNAIMLGAGGLTLTTATGGATIANSITPAAAQTWTMNSNGFSFVITGPTNLN